MTASSLLDPNQIDVWLAFDDRIVDPALLACYRELLSDEERARELRFHFPRDQKQYLVTRALLRTVLPRYAPIEPASWRFVPDEHGRPVIVNDTPETRRLRFNVSHTRGMIALAIADRRELGVDVENVRTRPAPIEIADRFFAPAEVADLAALSQERKHDRFLEYWTFKESYIKARGLGLAIPLQQFSFHYPHERGVRLHTDPQLGDDATRWCFWQFRPTGDHLLALCAEQKADASRVTMRSVVPLVTDENLPAEMLKTSGSPD